MATPMFLPGDPEYAAWQAEEERRKREERLAATHAPAVPAAAPADPAALLNVDVPRPEIAAPAIAAPSKPLPVAPQPAVDTQTSSQWSRTEKSQERTAGEAIALGKVQNAREGQKDTITASTELNKKKADSEEELAREEREAIAARQAAAEAQRTEANRLRTEAVKVRDEQRKAFKDSKLTDLWEDKGTGSKVLAYLMAGIGQYAATMSGGQNTALAVINDAVSRDLQIKREKIAQSKEVAEMSDRDVGSAERYMGLVDLDLKNREGDMYKKLAAERRARLAKFGRSEAEIAGDAQLKDFDARSAAADLTYEAGLRKEISKTAGGSTVTLPTGPAAGQGGMDPSTLIYGRDGKPVAKVGNKEDAQYVNRFMPTYRSIMGEAQELRDLLHEHGTVATGGKAAARMEQLQGSILRKLPQLEKSGTMDEGMIKVAEKELPNPTALLTSGESSVAKINGFMRSTDQKMRDMAASVGLSQQFVDSFGIGQPWKGK